MRKPLPDDAYRAGPPNGESQPDFVPPGRLGGFRRRQRLPVDIFDREKRRERAVAPHPGRSRISPFRIDLDHLVAMRVPTGAGRFAVGEAVRAACCRLGRDGVGRIGIAGIIDFCQAVQAVINVSDGNAMAIGLGGEVSGLIIGVASCAGVWRDCLYEPSCIVKSVGDRVVLGICERCEVIG